MNKYHHHCEEYPLSGKVFCQVCGKACVMRMSFRTENYGQKYWVCPAHRAGRYGPVSPKACGNGQRTLNVAIERGILESWNELVEQQSTVCQTEGQADDALTAYRIRDLQRQISEYGHLSTLPYDLLIRVLDHVEVAADGKMTMAFLAGVKLQR